MMVYKCYAKIFFIGDTLVTCFLSVILTLFVICSPIFIFVLFGLFLFSNIYSIKLKNIDHTLLNQKPPIIIRSYSILGLSILIHGI